ncbi:MAG TPA: hypothetical protein VN428_08905, partial [Bryobacteraceae bacterium]|nr:hypothetical protein [Bryobacteraceae bacterium]
PHERGRAEANRGSVEEEVGGVEKAEGRRALRRLPSIRGLIYGVVTQLRMVFSTTLLMVIALPASPQDPNTDLVEATNRVAAYWRGVFAVCSDRKFPHGVLNAEVMAGSMKGSVLQIAEPSFQFQTDQIDSLTVLNGTEFSATSTLRAAAARLFEPKTGWTAWKKAAEFTVMCARKMANGQYGLPRGSHTPLQQ